MKWRICLYKVFTLNPLSTNLRKRSNTLKQFVGCCRPIVWMCLTILWGWQFGLIFSSFSSAQCFKLKSRVSYHFQLLKILMEPSTCLRVTLKKILASPKDGHWTDLKNKRGTKKNTKAKKDLKELKSKSRKEQKSTVKWNKKFE